MKRVKLSVITCLAALLVAVFAMTAFAEGGMEMSTAYPGITTKAGDQLSFNLDFENSTGAGLRTDLSVAEIPEGWSGYFEGNSKEISSLYLADGSSSKAAIFNVTVPDDTQDGNYKIVLKATSAVGESLVEINLKVNAVALGGSSMESDYDSQQGTIGTTFTFSTTITNNSSDDQSFSFAYELPDAGWQISFKPSGESAQVSAVTVPAKSNSVVTITVVPSSEVTAGKYTIPVKAISATETLEEDLAIDITGAYKMSLTTPTGNLAISTKAKKKTAVTLNLTNTGNIDLENINLTSTVADGWTVEYSESTIDLLEAGATKEITAYVTSSDEVMNGDYACVLSAKTSETSSDATFRITVKTDTIWGIVGVIIILAALAGLGYVFKKYGRR